MEKAKCVLVGDDTDEKKYFFHDLEMNSEGILKKVQIYDETILLNIWNTIGGEYYKSLRPLSYEDVDLFLIAFSLVDQKSFNNVEKTWIPEITNYCPNVPYILVGMNSCLRDEYATKGIENVSTSKGEEMKQKIGALSYIECDISKKYNLDNVFKLVAKCILLPEEYIKKESNSHILQEKEKSTNFDSTEKTELNDEKKTFSITPPSPAEQSRSGRTQSIINSLKSNLENKIHENEILRSEIEQKNLDFIKSLIIQKKLQKQLEKVEKEKKDLEQELEKRKKYQPMKLDIINPNTFAEYKKLEDIGVGSSSRVIKVEKTTIYAMKIMNIMDFDYEKFCSLFNEFMLMNALNHPNILKVFSIYFGDDKNPPAIVLEFCPENLSHAISNNKLSNINMARAIYQIAEGMKFIHFQEIIHRDLKPSNILIAADGTIKISDFGISKLMSPDETTMTVGVGTNKFMAPEIIAEEDDYNEKVDVYSFGVLIFYILSNGMLPMIKTPQILQGKKAEIPSSFTEFSKNLINDCWNFKPSERPSFVDIVERLKTGCSQLLEFNEKEKNEVDQFVENYSKLILKQQELDDFSYFE